MQKRAYNQPPTSTITLQLGWAAWASETSSLETSKIHMDDCHQPESFPTPSWSWLGGMGWV